MYRNSTDIQSCVRNYDTRNPRIEIFRLGFKRCYKNKDTGFEVLEFLTSFPKTYAKNRNFDRIEAESDLTVDFIYFKQLTVFLTLTLYYP